MVMLVAALCAQSIKQGAFLQLKMLYLFEFFS
jgi:hypothetical protein